MEFIDARKYKKQIKNLYKTAFPRDERYPMPFLFYKADNVNNFFYAVLENGEFAGLIYTIHTARLVFTFYLAVVEEKRGGGIGTKILNELKKMHPDKTLVLTIEDTDKKDAPNMEQRLRRLKFYEANGYARRLIKINEAGVDFEVLATDDTVTKDEFIAMMKNYLGKFYFKIIYRNMRL